MSDVTQRAAAALVLWLCGSGLRLTILSLPPVIVAVQRDLALTGTEVGLLSGIPIVFFAAAAVPGSLLIARLGVVPTLVTGLIVTAFGSAARSLAASAWPFYAATMLMSVGVIGMYVGKIFDQVRARPLYVIEQTLNAPSRRNGCTESAGDP